MMDRAMVEPDRGCDWDSMSYLCLIVCAQLYADARPNPSPQQLAPGFLSKKSQRELGSSDTLLNQYLGAQIQ